MKRHRITTSDNLTEKNDKRLKTDDNKALLTTEVGTKENSLPIPPNITLPPTPITTESVPSSEPCTPTSSAPRKRSCFSTPKRRPFNTPLRGSNTPIQELLKANKLKKRLEEEKSRLRKFKQLDKARESGNADKVGSPSRNNLKHFNF